MPISKDLLDAWAWRKIAQLNSIIYTIDSYATLGEYEKVCPGAFPENVPGIDEKEINKIFAAIEQFKESGDLFFTFYIYDYDLLKDRPDILQWLFCDCTDLIQILIHNKKAIDKRDYLLMVDEWVNQLTAIMANIEGKYSIKYQQRDEKKDCGKGQKEALDRRINALANNLKGYAGSNGEISIPKNDFFGLVNDTFEGKENYPRHHSTYKDYHKLAAEKLKARIIIK